MRDLQACVKILEKHGSLARVKSEVSLDYELGGIAKKFEGKQCLLFEKIKGYDIPILCGLMWNRDNLSKIFNVPTEKLAFYIGEAFAKWKANPNDPNVKPKVIDKGIAQEVRIDPVDLHKLPTPTLALGDGGKYLANCVVIAKDPDTGVRNLSIHRFMYQGPDQLGILLDRGRHLRDYYERAEARGEPLQITINNGVDPAVSLAATSQGGAAPMDYDELGIASVMLGQPVELCKSLTVEPEGVANAQFIIEGEMLPNVRKPEAPFAEVAGYYGEKADRWVVKVKAITRRKEPLVHTLISGKEVWNYVGLTGEADIFSTISKQMGGVKNVHLAHCGGIYYTIVQMDPTAAGFGKQAIMATFAAFPPARICIVVNSDVNIYNMDDVQWAVATRCDPDKDLILVKNCFGHELNPMNNAEGMTTKMGLDCTCPIPTPSKFKRVSFQEVDLSKYDIKL